MKKADPVYRSVPPKAELEPILRDNLLKLAETYCKATGVSLDRVSRMAHGDPPFFGKLKDRSGSFSIRKYDEVIQWFASHWPKEIAFPALVDPRHKPS